MTNRPWSSAKWDVYPDRFTVHRQTRETAEWSVTCDVPSCTWMNSPYRSVGAAARSARTHALRFHGPNPAQWSPARFIMLEVTDGLRDAVREIRAARESQGCEDTGIAELELEDAIIWLDEFGGDMSDPFEDSHSDRDRDSDSHSDSVSAPNTERGQGQPHG